MALQERDWTVWDAAVDSCAALIERVRCRDWSPEEAAEQIRRRLTFEINSHGEADIAFDRRVQNERSSQEKSE